MNLGVFLCILLYVLEISLHNTETYQIAIQGAV